MKPFRYFSLFSGIGGFENGINRAYKRSSSNMESIFSSRNQSNSSNILRRASYPICAGFSEIDKYAIQIYKKHFPTHKEYGDVTNIKWSDVPDFELLCGGFPCQSFSIAGKRGGFLDTRGTLFFQIARAAQEKQPRLLLLENVKGLLSHDKGRTFGTILNTLDEIGYDLQWQVLNSKNFGVPQNRERVFIIGHLRTTPRPQIFPLTKGDSGNIKTQSESQSKRKRIWSDTASVDTRTGSTARGQHLIASTLAQRDYKGGNNLLDDGIKIRRLTPTECERLQGFPDEWTEKGIDLKGNEISISDTQRYKCLGNAVTVNVIEAIAKKLIKNLTSPADYVKIE